MRLALVSDTHGKHGELQRGWEASGDWDLLLGCDAVVHCGDGTRVGTPHEGAALLRWLTRVALAGPAVLLVPGNHDFCFDPAWRATTERGLERHGHRAAYGEAFGRLRVEHPLVHFLVDSGADVGGVSFWGSPVTPWFNDWAWNRARGADIRRHWDMVPAGVDVLVTHGPPRGVLDALSDRNWKPDRPEGRNPGCHDLLETVARVRPALHCFGHIHEARGYRREGSTLFVNCSSLDERYEPCGPPVFVDVSRGSAELV